MLAASLPICLPLPWMRSAGPDTLPASTGRPRWSNWRPEIGDACIPLGIVDGVTTRSRLARLGHRHGWIGNRRVGKALRLQGGDQDPPPSSGIADRKALPNEVQ